MRSDSPTLRGPALLLSLLLLCAFARAAPPTAPVRDTVETLHGVQVHDPYRYFENLADPEVKGWLREQGRFAREALDAIPGRDAMERRIGQLSVATGDAVGDFVRLAHGPVFYLRRPRGESQYKLMLRQGARERVLVDPEQEARRTGVPHAINYFSPSWDGRYLAYGMSAGGSEDASLRVIEVASGRVVNGPIPRVQQGEVGWLPDSRAFTYNQLRQLGPEDSPDEYYLDSRVMLLRVGADAAQARPVFGPTVTRGLGLERLDVGGLMFHPGSRWVLARATDTTQAEAKIFVAPVADLGRDPIPWRKVADPQDRIVETYLRGDSIFMRTHKDAPRYRIMELDLRQPELARARVVAEPPPGMVLEGFQLGRDAILAAVRDRQEVGLRLYRAGDARGQAHALPFAGAARLGTGNAEASDPDPAHAHADFLFGASGWEQPARILRLAGGRVADSGLLAARRPAGVPALEVRNVEFPSWDGVRVPMTVVHRKGLVLDGSHPTLVQGYGAYGLSQTARFSATDYAWYEKGGVIAFVNTRGSGAYGQDWRQAGFKATKPNTWKDGVAAARWLVAQGYATPRTLAVSGGSAGGIFAGRAVTSAPELFAAAIFYVPQMDQVRSETTANGITNISEFGSVKDAREFPAVLEMSTYHQVRDGTNYPAVMLVQGLNDLRVEAWHAAKAAARLQAASRSGKPILLRLDGQAGHGVGSTASQRHAMAADTFSFLLWQMGLAGR